MIVGDGFGTIGEPEAHSGSTPRLTLGLGFELGLGLCLKVPRFGGLDRENCESSFLRKLPDRQIPIIDRGLHQARASRGRHKEPGCTHLRREGEARDAPQNGLPDGQEGGISGPWAPCARGEPHTIGDRLPRSQDLPH